MLSKISAAVFSLLIFFGNLTGILPVSQTYYADLAYGNDENQVVDISVPTNAGSDAGLILFVHGGGWHKGDKAIFEKRTKNISKKTGCICATMNYRYASPEAGFEEMLEDVESVLLKVLSVAESKNIKCSKMILVGHSAGAHLSMLYCAQKKDSSPIEPCAIVSYSGPPDLRADMFIGNDSRYNPEYALKIMSYLTKENLSEKTLEERKKIVYEYSPLKFVGKDTLPMIIVHGEKDKTVNVEDVRNFVEELKKNDVPYKYFELPNSKHNLENDPDILKKSDYAFAGFIKAYLK